MTLSLPATSRAAPRLGVLGRLVAIRVDWIEAPPCGTAANTSDAAPANRTSRLTNRRIIVPPPRSADSSFLSTPRPLNVPTKADARNNGWRSATIVHGGFGRRPPTYIYTETAASFSERRRFPPMTGRAPPKRSISAHYARRGFWQPSCSQAGGAALSLSLCRLNAAAQVVTVAKCRVSHSAQPWFPRATPEADWVDATRHCWLCDGSCADFHLTTCRRCLERTTVYCKFYIVKCFFRNSIGKADFSSFLVCNILLVW